jgi:hypothetical protein
MQSTTTETAARGAVRVSWFLIGIVVYIVSFFLPAVGGMKGWRCAYEALHIGIMSLHNPFGILVFASGMLNPLVLIYTHHYIFRGRARPRWMALAALSFTLASGAFLALTNLAEGSPKADFSPHIGYSLWIGGVLFIIGRPDGNLLRVSAGRFLTWVPISRL